MAFSNVSFNSTVVYQGTSTGVAQQPQNGLAANIQIIDAQFLKFRQTLCRLAGLPNVQMEIYNVHDVVGLETAITIAVACLGIGILIGVSSR